MGYAKCICAIVVVAGTAFSGYIRYAHPIRRTPSGSENSRSRTSRRVSEDRWRIASRSAPCNAAVVCVMPVVNREPDYLHTHAAQFAAACPSLRVYDASTSPPYKFGRVFSTLNNSILIRVPMEHAESFIARALNSTDEKAIPAAFRPFVRQDPASFVTWRTREGFTMLYALNDTLTHCTSAKQIGWFQDDMVLTRAVPWKELFSTDVTCLRTGVRYCGATAFAFSRRFVNLLRAALENNIHVLPVDWIIETQSVGRIARRQIAAHIGQISSNLRVREVDL